MGLEYQFRNEPLSTRVELSSPDSMISNMTKSFDGATANFNTAIIRGTDKLWELSIMKFIVEETLASFSTNVQELKDRGFFEGEGCIETSVVHVNSGQGSDCRNRANSRCPASSERKEIHSSAV